MSTKISKKIVDLLKNPAYIVGMKRIGYGFNRSDREFDALNIEPLKLFIDLPGSERPERRGMFAALSNVDDAVVVLVANGDLGAGREINLLRKEIERLGATIEGPQDRDAPAAPAPRGRAPKFVPDEDADKTLRDMWQRPAMFTTRHVIDRASALTGKPVTRNQLNHRYGYRGE